MLHSILLINTIQSERVSDRKRYFKSLEMIRALDFDLIVPDIAAAGQPC